MSSQFIANEDPNERKSNSLAARCHYKRYFFSFVHYNLEMLSLCISLSGLSLHTPQSFSRFSISVFLTFIGFGNIKRTAQYLFSCHFAEKSRRTERKKTTISLALLSDAIAQQSLPLAGSTERPANAKIANEMDYIPRRRCRLFPIPLPSASPALCNK